MVMEFQKVYAGPPRDPQFSFDPGAEDPRTVERPPRPPIYLDQGPVYEEHEPPPPRSPSTGRAASTGRSSPEPG